MTTEAAPTPVPKPKRTGLIIAIVATVVVVIGGALAWPGIARRQKVSDLRESAHEAFLKSDWLAAVSSLHEAAQLRPTDNECRRDYEDMQDKWLRYVEEVLSNKTVEEAHGFLGLDANQRIREFLTEPVRTKFANVIDRNHQRVVALVKAAIAQAESTSTGGAEAAGFKAAHAALDKVAGIAGVAQAEYDKAREGVVLRDWAYRLERAHTTARDATKGAEGQPTDTAGYRAKLADALAQLSMDLVAKENYAAGTLKQVQDLLQKETDELLRDEWREKAGERLKAAGIDIESPQRVDLSAARIELKRLRDELGRVKGRLSAAGLARIGDDLTELDYHAASILVMQMLKETGEKVDTQDFDAAFALFDQTQAIAEAAEAGEGRRLLGAEAKQHGESEDQYYFTSKKFWVEAKASIIRLMEADNLGKLTAALQENNYNQAQLTLDKYARYSGRKVSVTGETLIGEKDLNKFLAQLGELNLSPAKGTKRTSYGDVFLVEKLRARFADPEAVQAFLTQAYAGWTRELLADRPGLALYTLKLGERATGALDTALEAEVVAKFSAKYPMAIYAGSVAGEQPGAAAITTPAWNGLTRGLRDATRGWVTWNTEAPPDADKDTVVKLYATAAVSESPREQVELMRAVRYQSGTQQVPNPDYQAVWDRLQAAQQEYQEAVNAADQAQATLDQASASGNSSGAIWAGAAALTARTAQGYAQGKRDNVQRELNSTPRLLTVPAYADETYPVITHRRHHLASLLTHVSYHNEDLPAATLPWVAKLRYSSQEIRGNAQHGVPVRKAVFLANNVINDRLAKILATQVAAQTNYGVLKLAAGLNAAMTKRVEELGLPGGGGAEIIDFGWGRAALWQRAGLDLGFAKEESAARGLLGLPKDEIVLAHPAETGVTLPGYVQENSLGLRLRPVPGTKVLFAQTETRVSDFKQFVDETGRKTTTNVNSLAADGWKPRGATWQNPGYDQDGDHPVVCVSWEDAEAFCDWLTKKERAAGRISEKQKYRLPTDAEWGIAAGFTGEAGATPAEKDGKTKGVYAWGNDWPLPVGAGNFAGHEVADADWPSNWAPLENYGDGYARTAPVGSFAANAYGLYDMGGNVTEICEDYYAKGPNRVGRDAPFAYNTADLLNVSARTELHPTFGGSFLGFRIVLELE